MKIKKLSMINALSLSHTILIQFLFVFRIHKNSTISKRLYIVANTIRLTTCLYMDRERFEQLESNEGAVHDMAT